MPRIFLIIALLLATSCASTPTKYGGPLAPQGRSGATWNQGGGSPESVVSAPVGSIYSRTGGGIGTALYVKMTGTGTTGWLPGAVLDGFYAAVGVPAANHGTLATGSKNSIGAVTTIGAFTSVTLTYSAAYPNDSMCVASFASVTTQEYIAMTAHSGSAVTFTCTNSSTNVAANCDDFSYLCFGR